MPHQRRHTEGKQLYEGVFSISVIRELQSITVQHHRTCTCHTALSTPGADEGAQPRGLSQLVETQAGVIALGDSWPSLTKLNILLYYPATTLLSELET